MSYTLPPHLAPYLTLNLFEELGISTWPPQEQGQFLERLGEVIHLRLIKRIIQTLNEEQRIRLEALLSQETVEDKALELFLQLEVPNFEGMIGEVIAEYKKDLLDKYAQISSLGTSDTDQPAA